MRSPYKYEASWNVHEFAFHILRKAANLVIISMAWITGEDAREFSRAQHEPDMDTLEYWLRRIEPLIRAETEGEIIVVFANRCGVEDEAVYAGTSAVLGIQGGEVKVYGMLGRGEEELLIVDTNEHPKWKLVSPTSTAAESERKEVKGPDDVRTNSAICGQYNTQSKDYEKSHPTVDAQRTAFTSLDLEGPPMEDIITPVSPVDASPHAYFAPKEEKDDGDTVKNPKQGIGHAYFSAAQPALPTFRWPISPESQNASPTRQLQRQVSTLISYDIALVVKSLPHPAAAAPGRCRSTITNNSFNTRRLHTSLRPKSALW
jgi:protein N-terminal amidase